MLYSLKFHHPRPRALAMVFLNILESTYLALLVSDQIAPLYHYMFGFLLSNELPSLSVLAVLTTCNVFIACLMALIVLVEVKCLSRLAGAVNQFLKSFVYVPFVPLMVYLMNVFTIPSDILTKVLGLFSMLFLALFALIHQTLNWSCKFRETDYCNRHNSSYLNLVLLVLGIMIVKLTNPLYGSIVYLVRAVFNLTSLCSNFEYRLVQWQHIFYSLLTCYMVMGLYLVWFGVVEELVITSVEGCTLWIVMGIAMCWVLTNVVVMRINLSILGGMATALGRVDGEIPMQKQSSMEVNFQNQIKMLVDVLLEREKMKREESNVFKYYWKVFYQRVSLHRARCDEVTCVCRGRVRKAVGKNESSKNKQGKAKDPGRRKDQVLRKDQGLRKKEQAAKKNEQDGVKTQNDGNTDVDRLIYISDLMKRVQETCHQYGKDSRLRILNIYLHIQIAEQPLKSYYEIMSLKREKVNLKTRLQIEGLMRQARQCFDQIFYKNKVQNQQLQLMKVIEYQQTVIGMEEKMLATIDCTLNFLEMFTYSSVKIGTVEHESKVLFELKGQIEDRLSQMVNQSAGTNNLSLLIFIFYRFLEIYRSREEEFKKVSAQQLMKKRIYQKSEVNLFSSHCGIIYIDLIQERGKIRRVTRNVCEFFGYAKEDMVSFNINLFMPRLYAKHHAKFLTDFIEKGKIRLLKQKNRVVFGKNKEKFIFPVQVRLKTEHLQANQFGASALLMQVDNNSQYVLIGALGKIEEISQQFYKRVFGKALREEITKVTRISLLKMLLSLNALLMAGEAQPNNKIHEGMIMYSDYGDYLLDKFRYSRENLTMSSHSSISMPVSLLTGTEVGTQCTQERQAYMAELFKLFLVDINLVKLRGVKVSYRYSKVKTAEFELDLLEVLAFKEEIEGISFYREALAEMLAVCESYRIYEEHSQLARHFEELQLMIDTLQRERSLTRTHVDEGAPDIVLSDRSLVEQMSGNSFLDEDEQDNNNEKKGFAVQQSEASSVVGNVENESKKQILINAFNGKESVVSYNTMILSNGLIVVLILLLVLSANFAYRYTQQIQELWDDNCYLLKITQLVEFRLALVELQLLADGQQWDQELLSVGQQMQQLNQMMKQMVEEFCQLTSSDGPNGLFAREIVLYDPRLGSNFSVSIIQILNQLLWMYEQPTSDNISLLRYNYETVHHSLNQFSKLKLAYLYANNHNNLQTVNTFVSLYEVILVAIGFSCLPVYIYYRKKELSVRGLLAYMNVKQIRKSMIRLRMLKEFLRNTEEKKGGVQKLQALIAEGKRNEKEDDSEVQAGNKSIKIVFNVTQGATMRNPAIYLALVGFILFFSNASIGFLALSQTNNKFFLDTLAANNLVNALYAKTPLLVNIHISNINRFADGQPIKNFLQETYSQASLGYFDLLDALSSPTFTGNSIAANIIMPSMTGSVCALVNCTSSSAVSFLDISRSFYDRFAYWQPANNARMDNASITNWLRQNHMQATLSQMRQVLQLWKQLDSIIVQDYSQYTASVLFKLLLVSLLLIPLNSLLVFLMETRFLALLNRILKSSQHIFMHFHVNVLVENTYLTSYFNSKIKSSK